jgi:hypothetical protein
VALISDDADATRAALEAGEKGFGLGAMQAPYDDPGWAGARG